MQKNQEILTDSSREKLKQAKGQRNKHTNIWRVFHRTFNLGVHKRK